MSDTEGSERRGKETDEIPRGPQGSSPLDPTRALDESDQQIETEDPMKLSAGSGLGEFQILELLGRGAFASVYLAHQISLERQVALKVTQRVGSEARTLASLEHDNIVRVFSQDRHQGLGVYLICMQFVPGTDLEHVLNEMEKHPRERRTGALILELIERLCRHPSTFDPTALRDREYLARLNLVDSVCWLGAKLAEGLSHAHSQGVLHQDIKPANILLNRYGRPLLSDFNMARSIRPGGERQGPVGGTLRYMAPEHLEAFNPQSLTTSEVIDERTDIYSLGLVLFEMLTSRSELEQTLPECDHTELLARLAQQRRERILSPRVLNQDVPLVMDHVVQRCLEPEPKDRYQTAEELAQVLKGCQELGQMQRGISGNSWLARSCWTHPFLMAAILTFLPHVLGSIVNITYNRMQVVDSLLPIQKIRFNQLVLAYNILVYPLGVWILFRTITPPLRALRDMQSKPIPPQALLEARRQALRFPGLVVIVSCLSWIPGGLIFPFGIEALSQPVAPAVYGHFLVSFLISGLIATTYAWFGTQYLVLRSLYPRLWIDPVQPRELAGRELRPIERRTRFFQFSAGLIPLGGAILLLWIDTGESLTFAFRLLVIALIGLGMLGFGLTLWPIVSSVDGFHRANLNVDESRSDWSVPISPHRLDHFDPGRRSALGCAIWNRRVKVAKRWSPDANRARPLFYLLCESDRCRRIESSRWITARDCLSLHWE